METEFARLLLIYEDDFKTFYEMLTASDYFHHMVDTTTKYDMMTLTKTVDFHFDIMMDQKEAFMATIKFVREYCNTILTNLVIESSKISKIISIHVTKEQYGNF